jgi:hypothetical protein
MIQDIRAIDERYCGGLYPTDYPTLPDANDESA